MLEKIDHEIEEEVLQKRKKQKENGKQEQEPYSPTSPQYSPTSPQLDMQESPARAAGDQSE